MDTVLQVFHSAREWATRLLESLTPERKKQILFGAPALVLLYWVGSFFYTQASYGALFTNLSPQDGAAVVRELEADKIPYLLRGDGSSVEVPKDILYRTRLRLASKGIPMGGGVGFEIFEKTPFGVSEFTQQVNYLRALQGELSRTINALDSVRSSRVHLALPARSAFLGPEEKPSASVVVDIKPGYHLTPEQVQGILNLVAGSVPKLTPARVTVVDATGRPLRASDGGQQKSDLEVMHQFKLRLEQEMEQRVETMLEPILGPGKAIVRVSAQVSFQETQLTKERFDPSNQVVRAQQQMTDDSGLKPGGVPGVQSNIPGGDATKGGAKQGGPKKSGQVVSYEIGRTLSRIVEPRGQIQRLSVAVLVDGKYEKGAYVPRTPAEMELLKEVVTKAVGFNAERGDQVEVANIPFKPEALPPAQAAQLPDLRQWAGSPQGLAAGAGAILLLLLAALLLRKKGRKKQKQAAEKIAAVDASKLEARRAAHEPEAEPEKIILTKDARREQLVQVARDYHDATVRILRMWLEEEAPRSKAARESGREAEGH